MNNKIDKKGSGQTGSVLIIGGGIAGMQAALDLAESGYFVYIAEQESAIGGVMAQLDKTFPTNDCAMCIISPKLVEVGRHINIKILPLTNVEDIEGEPGNFKVRVRHAPRFVDTEKCTACGECTKVCPIDLPNFFDEGLRDRNAIYKRYPQGMPGAYAISKLGTSPCKVGCPAHISIQGFIALIAQGKYKEGLELIKKEHPFPAACGRVCHHPCEEACTRAKLDKPLAIEYLKRFLADMDLDEETRYIPEIKERREEKIAIIGSGPAGLTAAYYLAWQGYQVTVYEKLPVKGGMMRVGIPEYRLPRNILEAEIKVIEDMGVVIKTGVTFGRDITLESLKDEGCSAVYLATGLHLSRGLNIDGEDLPGILKGVDFLREVSLGNEISLGKSVVVVGGGNVAIDVALTAKRLGAEDVKLVCLETRSKMPAWDYEIEEALEEGIEIVNCLGPKGFIKKGDKVSAVEFKKCTSVCDSTGCFNPSYDEGDITSIEADNIIVAIGQTGDLSYAEAQDISVTKRGGLEADPVTYQTNLEWVFAGGDIFYGPRSVVEAVECGKEAAISIDRYINGEDIKKDRNNELKAVEIDPTGEPVKARIKMSELSVEDRKNNFKEIALGFTEDDAKKEAERCLSCGLCSECYQCVDACLAGAINHQDKEIEEIIEVGAVILTPGFDPYIPSQNPLYNLNAPNVVTSLAFERILSASGPYEGHLIRPSDHKEPKKIAWLQCVGSRSKKKGDHTYCSSVCCMYAIKQAVIAKEHSGDDLDTSIFFMDIRTFGKDFERYYTRAKDETGVRFIRSRVHSIIEDSDTNDILIRYVDEGGETLDEKFDMAVLSVGIEPSRNAVKLAQKLGIELNDHNFCYANNFTPVNTNLPGIYVSGTFEGPKDIPETVTQASAAASHAQKFLTGARNTKVKKREYPTERDILNEEPRIGVFVCNCGINIGAVVDVPGVTDYAATLPNVVFADNNLFTCSQDTQDKIKDVIKEKKLNRIVVASCSPRTHESLFQETLQSCGLNKYLFEMANIRDQDSWVHQKEAGKASKKAMDLVRMAVAKVWNAKPLDELAVPVEPSALIIGAGVAGINTAINIADQGYKVHLVEQSDKLGGIAVKLHYTLEGDNVPDYLKEIIKKVKGHPGIKLYLKSEIVDHSGFIGNFTSTVSNDDNITTKLNHGITVVATGARIHEPDEYGFKEYPTVITSLELEKRIAEDDTTLKDIKNIVMIQCVGSRNDNNPNCSRICCQGAVKNCLRLKHINPDCRIYILYRDMRTYGFAEDYYQKARESGIIFIRFDKCNPPEVKNDDKGLFVVVSDHVLDKKINIRTDIVSLSVGIEGNKKNPVSTRFKLPLNIDGYFCEAHMKLRPVDFASDGNFLAGLAHGPKSIRDTIIQAEAAAARAVTVLAKDHLLLSAVKAMVVNEGQCVACLTCMRACPYNVPQLSLKGGVIEIQPAACQGCGICVSACPRKAIQLANYTDSEILAKVAAI